MVVNKADINLRIATEIENAAVEGGAVPRGRIPYDPAVIKAMVHRRCPVEEPNSAIKREYPLDMGKPAS